MGNSFPRKEFRINIKDINTYRSVDNPLVFINVIQLRYQFHPGWLSLILFTFNSVLAFVGVTITTAELFNEKSGLTVHLLYTDFGIVYRIGKQFEAICRIRLECQVTMP